MRHYGTPETANDRASRVVNERSPYLRLIWDEGYDEVRENYMDDCLELVCRDLKLIKKIAMDELRSVVASLTIKGGAHRWIAASDGSEERFRNLIRP